VEEGSTRNIQSPRCGDALSFAPPRTLPRLVRLSSGLTKRRVRA
jgi:hypothetical protein